MRWCDNYATHKHPNVQGWLARNPRITMHFTPTRVVAEPGRDLLRHHHPASHPPRYLQLRRGPVDAISGFIDGWNDRCQPFSWTKTADEILPNASGGQRTSFTRH